MKIPFGLHVVKFDGGLGNQMFEYAFYLALRQKFPYAFYAFDTYSSEVAHNGYELDTIFNIESRCERKRYAFFRKLERHNYIDFSIVKEDNYMLYCPAVYNNILSPHEWIGFWQTEKYFSHIERKIRKVFRFKEEMLSKQTILMAREIKKMNNPISVHIRRGDYLAIDSTKTFGLEYYNTAISLLRNDYIGGKIIVFSDDVNWCRENLHYDDIMFVDWNKGVNSWQDMYLMSLCKFNIIANSSFSWWGAWLNNNMGKQVIAPLKWMKEEPENSDIIPNSWIRI